MHNRQQNLQLQKDHLHSRSTFSATFLPEVSSPVVLTTPHVWGESEGERRGHEKCRKEEAHQGGSVSLRRRVRCGLKEHLDFLCPLPSFCGREAAAAPLRTEHSSGWRSGVRGIIGNL